MAREIVVQVTLFRVQMQIAFVQRGEFGVDLRDQPLRPVHGAAYIVDLSFDVAALGFGIRDRGRDRSGLRSESRLLFR